MRSVWSRVEGRRMHGRVAGPAVGDPGRDVLLVHGLAASSRYMLPLAAELARDFRVHVPDLPGFGLSEPPRRALGLAAQARALDAWAREHRLRAPVLVANSVGCAIAVELLAAHAGRFPRAVLQGPVLTGAGGRLRELAARWLRAGLHEPALLHAILLRDYMDCGPRFALATARHAASDADRVAPGDVAVPVLVVRGGRDRLTSRAEAAALAADLANGQLMTLPGVSHAMNFSAAQQLAALIRRFAEVPARRGRGGARPAQKSVAGFDSATAMLRASSRALRGEGMQGLGTVPRRLAPVAEHLVRPVNLLPGAAREEIYRRASGAEGVAPEQLHRIDLEEVARWATRCHPAGRRYPAAVIGSSSGAAMHLAAALGAPFLPQTLLVPVRQPDVSPDDPRSGFDAGRGPAQLLLDANPDVRLHHMHDPNQDRLTLARMAYFRVKRHRLGRAYAEFLETRLAPGATLLVADCRLRWPVTRLDDRHVFQLGAVGGLPAGDFARRWRAPAATGDAPEAEWGFDADLMGDLRALAQRRRLRLRRVVFEDPEDLSPLVADLHRWWYGRRGMATARLLAESFVLVDPWWAVRTRSVPLWLKFAVEPSAERLARYLAAAEPFPDVRVALFSHGAEGAGLAPIDRWRSILAGASGTGGFLGVDESRFPRDFASFGSFNRELRALGAAGPAPVPLSLGELDEFVAARGDDGLVGWPDG